MSTSIQYSSAPLAEHSTEKAQAVARLADNRRLGLSQLPSAFAAVMPRWR